MATPMSTSSRPFTKALALTFILNTKGIVCTTRSRVALNSHIHSSHDLLFTTPLATYGCPETDKEDTGLGELKMEKNILSCCQFGISRVFSDTEALAESISIETLSPKV